MLSMNDFNVVRITAQAKDMPAIYLVGPMGAGKTTIGRLLAKNLGRDFFDSDHYVERNAGADIAWIFEKEGEAGFRVRETRALAKLTQKPSIVLATGGGAVITAQNRALLRRGLVIYLNASVQVQLERTQKDKARPLLQNSDPLEKLSELYSARDHLYRQLADIEIITGAFYPRQMVKEILRHLQDLGISA